MMQSSLERAGPRPPEPSLWDELSLRARIFAVSVLSAATALGITSGCTSDESPDPSAVGVEAQGPAYAVLTRIQLPTGRLNYVNVVPSLQGDEIDLSRALEVGDSPVCAVLKTTCSFSTVTVGDR